MNGIANSFAAHLALDPYNRAARLTPALLTIAPVVVLFYCFYGTSNPLLSAIISLLGWCGGGYALTRIARNAGSRIQDKLFEKWGGAPTTQLLRHSTPDIDPYTKARCHSILAKALKTGAPTAESEAANPAAADNFYRAATRWLIAQTKGHQKIPGCLPRERRFWLSAQHAWLAADRSYHRGVDPGRRSPGLRVF